MARAKRTSKKAAEYAARADEALAQRKALIGAIGAAEEKFEHQQDAVAEAQRVLDELAGEVADAYQQAIDGGWTAAELKTLGIPKPDAKPSKTSKSSGTKTTSQHDTNPGDTHAAETKTAGTDANSHHDDSSTPSNAAERAYQ